MTIPSLDSPRREQVAYGALELDRLEPDWYKRVSARTLDMGCDERCVLGQLHGNYSDGRNRYGWKDADAAVRGFYVPDTENEDWEIVEIAYEELTDFWVQEINARLLADEAAAQNA